MATYIKLLSAGLIDLYFKSGITWTDVSSGVFSARIFEKGFIFDTSGPSLFSDDLFPIIGFLCTRIANRFLNLLNPTLHYLASNVSALPYLASAVNERKDEIEKNVKQAIEISKYDWDSTEYSWNFQKHPLLKTEVYKDTIAASALSCFHYFNEQFLKLKEIERTNNSIFLEIYDLLGEQDPSVNDNEIALLATDPKSIINSFISFFIGCTMGRYSLDQEGLVYAHFGNEGFNQNLYNTYPADADGIVPIADYPWFQDDAANRFSEFISVAWPREHLSENLQFVAESLTVKDFESAEEVIRKYFLSDFFKNHLKMYKKRPIYWLFSSGKLKAFQALVYLHRYNESTLASMRTVYVIPLLGKMASRIEQLEKDIEASSSRACPQFG